MNGKGNARRQHVVALITAVILTISLSAPLQTAAWHEDTLVTSLDTPYLAQVMTDGSYVVWSTAPGGASNSGSITAVDLASGDEIAVGSVRGGAFDLDDGIVVWTFSAGYHNLPPEYFGVFARNLRTGEESVVSPGPWVGNVSVSEGVVLWREFNQDTNESPFKVRQIGDLNQALTVPRFDAALDQMSAFVEDGWVYWLEGDLETGIAQHAVRWRIGEPAPSLMEGMRAPFSVHGHMLYYVVEGLLHARDLTTSDVSIFDTGYVLPGPGVTDGRYMFWTGGAFDDPGSIVGFDMQTRSTFVAADITATIDERGPNVGSPSIAGGMLAWGIRDTWGDIMSSEVHLARLSDRLPTGFRSGPDTPDANMTYYPETGHYLSSGFRDYWQANGGLPRYGYPLTEEYQEVNPDTGAMYTVQYFERQRFEWHPENRGTPYEVLLGRLGVEQADRLRLLDSEEFRPRGDDEGPDAGCFYFRETGHYVCDYFRFYWEEHGLEFGDEGVSYRESLALFGYPISEPFMTANADGHTVLTQYFERAVFEWHPENQAPYKVLLRRLGAESLTAQGW